MRSTVGTLLVLLVVVFTAAVTAGYAFGAQVNQPSGSESVAAPTTALRTTTAVPVPTTEPLPPETTEPRPETTSTRPPATEAPQRRGPLRVVMAGDSVMAGLSPALKAALGSDADVRFVLTPSILRDPAVRFTWTQQLEEFDPELIVMFVGTWESGVARTDGLAPSDPRWREAYERETLDPWIDLITSRGARVIWIGNPTVRNADANPLFAALNTAFRDMPSRWPAVRYLDANPSLNGPEPGYHDVVPGIGGRRFRTRQTDGLHLCADGAALLGRAVALQIDDWFTIAARSGWEDDAWRGDVVYPPESCPAP